MIIEIPIKLVSESNSTEHWSKKHKRHKQQKFLVIAYLKTQPFPKLPCHVILTRFSPRAFDSDNLQTAFKYVRDAISEYVTGCTIAGRADSDSRISWEYLQEKEKSGNEKIKIEIRQKTK